MIGFTHGFVPQGGRGDRFEFSELAEQFEQGRTEERNFFASDKVNAELLVELPFWMLVPEGDVELSIRNCLSKTTIYQHALAIYDGPLCLSSHGNLVYVGNGQDVSHLDKIKAPVTRPMKTLISFSVSVYEPAISAFLNRRQVKPNDHVGIRSVNRSMQYFEALSLAHLEFLNQLITSYRAISYDPFAVEVAEWDVPVWFLRRENDLCVINIMPYADSTGFPYTIEFENDEQKEFFATDISSLRNQCEGTIEPGKRELLDAKSLMFRGRYSEAVRTATTAIEVVLESKLREKLSEMDLATEQVEERLALTHNSFFARLEDFESVAKRRVPGPILSHIPYINGLRYKEELGWVRNLRHKIVHEGVRVDRLADRGQALRAVETMTWIYEWIQHEKFGVESTENYAFYNNLRGQPRYVPEYLPTGIEIKQPNFEQMDASPMTGDLLDQQFEESITHSKPDIELLVMMALESALGIECLNAPPTELEAFQFERFRATINGVACAVFCLSFAGSIEPRHLEGIKQRIEELKSDFPDKNIHGLAVVNHETNQGVHLRLEEACFDDDTVLYANESGITLISTRDICRTIRSGREHGWCREHILCEMLLPGRRLSIPNEYCPLGKVRKIFPKPRVASVAISKNERLQIGDTIGIRGWNLFRELTVTEMQLNGEPVNDAVGPVNVGIKVEDSILKTLKEKQFVFLKTATKK